jgi:NAD(P)-dependent dehydrogenase (short-subunit alcohol dehydrogenase family)
MGIMEKFDLKGRCAIVTGAAKGLGKAMAEALADAGASIIIADIDVDTAEMTAGQLVERGTHAIVVKTDVTEKKDCDLLVEASLEKFGSIDILVNNAGICVHEKAEEMSYNDWKKVMDVNINGVFLLSQAVGKMMIRQKKGSIINISSMSGIIVNTPQCQCAYNTSKAGVIMLTKSLAAEWIEHNIRVNAIAPGYMKTELTRPYFEENSDMVKRWLDFLPAKRPGDPEELGGLVVYLASDASSYTTGGVFVVDGGYTLW